MNYKQAKIKAQMAADASGMDYVIIGTNKNYDIAIAKRHKGEFIDLISPSKVEEIIEQETSEEVIEKPKRNVSKKA
jgi:hypothetical protein